MNRSTRLSLLVLGVCFGLGCPITARATKIIPPTWQERVANADLVGIVECETAGGIVARYRVVEPWKGPKVGTSLSIRAGLNYWGQQFPIALCGQRFYVTAYKENVPSHLLSTSVGGAVPLWWRRIPADYEVPLGEEPRLLSPGAEKSRDFQKVRDDARRLLALPAAEQEAAVLRAVIDENLLEGHWIGGEKDPEKLSQIRKQFNHASSAEALVDEVLRMVASDPDKWGIRAGIVLEKGGGRVGLSRLKAISRDKSPWRSRDERAEIIERIEGRLGLRSQDNSASRDKEQAPPSAPSQVGLATMRRNLGNLESREFEHALEVLTVRDPASVARFLVEFTDVKEPWDRHLGYSLGSYFGWRCGKDRVENLKMLSKAKDPEIRVAGAVYLCFDDEAAGARALRKLTTLSGDAGVWAALTLARRGHKDAVPRALEVFRVRPLSPEEEASRTGMSEVPHRNLQDRLLVLLSNSARASRVPQPPLPKEDSRRFDALSAWWKSHADRITVHDPWLEILIPQKVD